MTDNDLNDILSTDEVMDRIYRDAMNLPPVCKFGPGGDFCREWNPRPVSILHKLTGRIAKLLHGRGGDKPGACSRAMGSASLSAGDPSATLISKRTPRSF